MRFSPAALSVLGSTTVVLAQTSTTCNPLEKSCPPDTGLNQASFSSDFTAGASALKGWSADAGTTLSYGSQGAEFTIKTQGNAPTITTDFDIFFGTIEVTMQAAPGTGIVSSIVLLSDDLDEIDWEILGGNTTTAETNYFGKGNTTLYDRAIYYDVANPQTTVHTYTIDWSPERIIFSVDGKAVRTLAYADAVGGTQYPQTPMQLRIGTWDGGASSEPAGTVAWAGGSTNYANAPFTMYLSKVKITNANPASQYKYKDTSGSWQSIQIDNSSASTGSSSSPSTPSNPSNPGNPGNPINPSKPSDSKPSQTSGSPSPSGSKSGGNLTTSPSGPASGSSNDTSTNTSSSSSTSSSAPEGQASSGAADALNPFGLGLIMVFTLAMCMWMM